MTAEKDDGCRCPRCHDHIPEQFYCRNCGYVPDWRQKAYEESPRHAGKRRRRELKNGFTRCQNVEEAVKEQPVA